jgi:hypothetical protein
MAHDLAVDRAEPCDWTDRLTRARRAVHLIIFGALLIATAPQVRAAAEDASPEAVTRAAMGAMKTDRMDEFADAMHPDALKQFHSAMSTIVDEAAKARKANQLLPLFQDVASVEELKKLDDKQFFVAFLRGMTGRSPDVKRHLAGAEAQILGSVPEGKDTTHVVYRLKLTTGGATLDRMTVASLRRDGSGWKMLLTGDVEGMVAALKQGLASGRPALPDLAASKVQAVGRVLEGNDTADVVYRMTTPMGTGSVTKLGALSVAKTDPEWATARDGNAENLTNLVRQKLGLGQTPRAR